MSSLSLFVDLNKIDDTNKSHRYLEVEELLLENQKKVSSVFFKGLSELTRLFNNDDPKSIRFFPSAQKITSNELDLVVFFKKPNILKALVNDLPESKKQKALEAALQRGDSPSMIEILQNNLPANLVKQAQQIALIKKVANIWELKGPAYVSQRKINLKTGGYPKLYTTFILKGITKFCQKRNQSDSLGLKNFYRALYQAAQILDQSENFSKQEIHKLFDSGATLSIATGWAEKEKNYAHSVVFIAKKWEGKGIFAIVNRGAESKHAISFYVSDKLPEQSELSSLLYQIKEESSHATNKKLLYFNIFKQLRARPLFHLEHSPQLFPNCAWISPVTSIHAMMLLELLPCHHGIRKLFNSKNIEESELFKNALAPLFFKIKQEYQALFNQMRWDAYGELIQDKSLVEQNKSLLESIAGF